MERKVCCLVVLAMVVLAAVAFAAQKAPETTQEQEDVYTIQKGDTLWGLEGAFSGKPWQWHRLLELNPFLKKPGRIWTNEKGLPIVLLKVNEQLRGLKELGIIPKLFPLERLRVEAPKPVQTSVPTAAKPDYSWSWWLLVLLIFAVCILVLRRYVGAGRNPVTAGPAIVQGGVTDATVGNQFRENISRTTGTPVDRVEIRDITRGRGYGVVRATYRDVLRRIVLTGQTLYRAMVRRNGGSWSQEYMLQGCGNDLRMSGARYLPGLGFRFVPETVVDEGPRLTAPTTTPVTEHEPTSVSGREGEKHFTFRPAAGGRPNMVDFNGFASFEVEVRDGRTTVRFS